MLEGSKITSLLGSDDAFRTIEVPPQIVIHRSGRAITRDEVLAAIRTALVNGGFAADQVRSEDVNYSSSVMLSGTGDAQLGVTRTDFDSGLQQVRFLLKSHADNGSLPFLVTAPLRGSVPVAVPSHEIVRGQILAESDLHKENRSANSAQAIISVKLEQLLGKRAWSHPSSRGFAALRGFRFSATGSSGEDGKLVRDFRQHADAARCSSPRARSFWPNDTRQASGKRNRCYEPMLLLPGGSRRDFEGVLRYALP